MEAVLRVAGAIILAFGGAAAILLACANWLGKVWAARILEEDRAKYAHEIERLRGETSEQLARLTTQLDTLKQTELRIHSDKHTIYRAAIDIIADMVSTLEKFQAGRLDEVEGKSALDRFYKSRLQLYGYLGMLAPQPVMDAQDGMMEFLLEVINGERPPDWAVMRSRALRLLNAIRLDIGIDKSAIEYRGSR